MNNPNLPTNPFIKEGDAEDTQNSIDCVLAYIQLCELGQLEISQHSEIGRDKSGPGLLRILDGVRDAVKYLSHLDAVPFDNVTRLEVKS